MPKNISNDMPVVDPLAPQPAPKLSDGEQVKPELDPNAAPPRARVRRRKGQEPEVVLATVQCPGGHEVARTAKFCPECGQAVLAIRHGCPNGHEVESTDKFCPACGMSLGVMAASSGGRPLTPEEQASKEEMHRRAVLLGNENPVMVYASGHAPPGAQVVLVHFLVDGFGAFGNVWYRGQEIEVWPGHPRWCEAQDWINLDPAGQFRRYGRQVFGHGPWPGAQSYTAAAGHFQQLGQIGGEGVVPQPTEEELARADEAERRRGRQVPLPVG